MSLQKGILRRTNDSSWCTLKLADGTHFQIPNYTRVIQQDDGYMISEGRYSGQRLYLTESMKIDSFDYSNGINIQYLQNKNQLLINGFDALTIVNSTQQITSGIYYILLPEYPVCDLIKEEYLDENAGGSSMANVWFPLLKEDGTRTRQYIHFGTISDGCITVKFPDHGRDWNLLVKKLLQSRIRSGIIGTLRIT